MKPCIRYSCIYNDLGFCKHKDYKNLSCGDNVFAKYSAYIELKDSTNTKPKSDKEISIEIQKLLANIDLKELAANTGISLSTLQMYRNGSSSPNLKKLCIILKYFNKHLVLEDD